MPNNLATLNAKLTTQLRDTSHVVWATTEKDDLVTWAVADLYPRYAVGMDPETSTVTLVANDYFYPLPTGMVEVTSVDLVDTSSIERGRLDNGTWNLVGDPWGTQKIRVSPSIVEIGGTLRLHGWGRYDTSTNLIPDHLVPLALAIARLEAYNRVAGEAGRFEQYQAADPTQQASINQLLTLVDSAENDVRRLRATLMPSKRMPVPGRLGV